MKLFKALFDLATLPINIATDAFTALNDLTECEEPFRRTRDKIEELDDDLEL